MGLYDSVMVPCPHCGRDVEFQTKADDDAYCRRFTLETASADMLFDIMNEPNHCARCDGWFALVDPRYPPDAEKPKPALDAVRVRSPGNPRTHFQGMKWWPLDEPFTFADILPDATETESSTKEQQG